ncbi:MAG: glutamine--fructose-6-phosphate transaminase (isomerizing) [Nanoarchaeota archaeon]|nr:glutamine--fructose-6-phosphate transaminase (isomerizing) [Nanoarchaeota archaeon]
MCGIIGYIGERDLKSILIKGLNSLEYRGYDSAGISFIENNSLKTFKSVGKVKDLDNSLKDIKINSNIGIAHTRWSTTGEVTLNNAHPHIDCNNQIAVVHNGIIENYSSLKSFLEKNNHKFTSETDTEIIAHLVEHFSKENGIEESLIKSLKLIEGAYAIALISNKEPDKIYVAKLSSPLIIGVGEHENFIASDNNTIIQYTNKVIYLNDNEIAIISKNNVQVKNLEGIELNKDIQNIHLDLKSVELNEFPHFMLKEIYEQPETIKNAMRGRIKNNNILFGGLNLTLDEIRNINRIIIIACGTSWHAGLIGKHLLEDIAKIPTTVEYASEFRYSKPIIDNNNLVLALSQSGETADTIAALKEAKEKNAKVLGIVNVVSSTIARITNAGIYLHAGPEIGVASTKTFTSHLVVLYMLSLFLAKQKGILSIPELNKRIKDLEELPEKVKQVLKLDPKIKEIAEKYFNISNVLYLGRYYNFPVALEGALKLKEISYIHAEGYPAAEMKHGPIALIDENMPCIFIAPEDKLYSKIINNIDEVKSRKGKIIAITTEDNHELKDKVDEIIYIPKTSMKLTPILTVIPLQLLAYHIAVKRGCDCDQPRNLSKVVTVE